MKYTGENRKKLQQVKKEANLRFVRIRSNLLPDGDATMTAEDLSRRLAEKLRTLSPDERRAMHVRISLAAADLERLGKDLTKELRSVAHELRVVRGNSQAVTAYARWQLPGEQH